MKLTVFCGLVIVAVLASISASAQVPPVVYDKFEEKVLNPDNWFGKEGSDPGVFALESWRQIKVEPLFGFRGLDIANRSYASEGSDSGNSTAYTRLLFADGSNVTSIQATVLVRKIQATECATNAFATTPRLRIGGGFFNAGVSAPPAGNQTDDVFAFVGAARPIDSENLPNVLSLEGRAFVCNDASCSTNTLIGSVDLGTVKVNKKVKLRVTWDPDNNRFVFQKGKDTEVYIDYTQPNNFPPGTSSGGNKRLEINHQIANCTSAPRPVAYMEAFFDDIKVNAPPAP
jgi:hypothetical protein